jgi:hypothetical protein
MVIRRDATGDAGLLLRVELQRGVSTHARHH